MNINKVKQWEETILGWEQSDVSQNEWCRRNNLKAGRFHYWLKKLKLKEEANVKFKEIISSDEMSNQDTSSHLRIKISNVTIEIMEDVNLELLKSVIQVLKSC